MVLWELDSFFGKFKNLLCAEKNATLTLKSEAGKAYVTLSLDLGHVHSDHGQPQPRGPRNGPARQRRREKRAAARADAENALAEGVEEAKDIQQTEKVEEVLANIDSAAEGAAVSNSAAKAKESDEIPIENVENSVKDLEDELCPDEIYGSQITSKSVSVGTQPLECGVASYQPSKSSLDFYTLTYDDYEDSE